MPEIIASGAAAARDDLLAEGLGYKAWTWPHNGIVSASALGSGGLYSAAVYLKAGTVITGVALMVNGAAAGLTISRVCLHNSALALVASSTNDTNFTTVGGLQQKAFTAAYTVPTSGVYYVGYCVVGATPATIAIGATVTGMSDQLAGQLRPAFIQGGLADVPDPAVPAATTQPRWFGLY